MLEKALNMVLNISGNINPAARLNINPVNFKVRILLILFPQVIIKHLTMNAFITLESLTEMP